LPALRVFLRGNGSLALREAMIPPKGRLLRCELPTEKINDLPERGGREKPETMSSPPPEKANSSRRGVV